MINIADYLKEITPLQTHLRGGYELGDLLKKTQEAAEKAVSCLNEMHKSMDSTSPQNLRELFFHHTQLFKDWNEQSEAQITCVGHLPSPCTLFKDCYCYVETPESMPLIIHSDDGITRVSDLNLEENRAAILEEMERSGALIFRNFGVNKDTFATAFSKVVGKETVPYPGDSPRPIVADGHVMESTAVADDVKIPLHQECSGTLTPPSFIGFLCTETAETGGETTFASAERITMMIKSEARDIWEVLDGATLTYTMRLLPDSSWTTTWIRSLNPSHTTITRFFGTNNRSEITAICEMKGLAIEWDGDWAVVSRKGVPATKDGVYHAQIHVDVLSPELCGGKLNYWAARALLYPTEESRQYSVHFSNGREIPRAMAERLLRILKRCEIAPQWQDGDMRVQSNHDFHGKLAHTGEREISVVMA